MPGKLIVLSAPSGAGKTTIYKTLLSEIPHAAYSISVTTRQPRTGEVNGRDYFFVSEKEFQDMIEKGAFLEYARVHNNWYGTRRSFIEDQLAGGKHILLDIDVQGALNIKKQMPEAVLFFIMAPSMEELKKRLISRGTDSMETIQIRLANARKEIQHKDFFDHVVVNDNLRNCLDNIKQILQEETRHEFSR